MFKVVIPTRWDSTRLPQKAILPVAGKPLTICVLEQTLKSDANEVFVALDHEKILNVVGTYYGRMTSQIHQSGTDRVAEVADIEGWNGDTIIVNVQGDEPLIHPETINQVAKLLQQTTADIATLFKTGFNLANENVVKVNCCKGCNRGKATKFSRKPWDGECYEHIGIYAYTVDTLKRFVALERTENEIQNRLEQLRALDNGFDIVVERALYPHPFGGVDTQEDLDLINQTLEIRQQV